MSKEIKYYSRRKRSDNDNETDYDKIEKQRLKNNLLGIIILILIIILAFDMGGCAGSLTYLTGK